MDKFSFNQIIILILVIFGCTMRFGSSLASCVGDNTVVVQDCPDDYTISLESSGVYVPDGDDRIGTMYSSGRYSVDSRCSQLEDVSVDAVCKDATIRLSLLLEDA